MDDKDLREVSTEINDIFYQIGLIVKRLGELDKRFDGFLDEM